MQGQERDGAVMLWRRKQKKEESVLANGQQVAVEEGRNPLRADIGRFAVGYLQGRTREQLIGESEKHFRQHPEDLVALLSSHGTEINFDRDYLEELRQIYEKLSREGLL